MSADTAKGAEQPNATKAQALTWGLVAGQFAAASLVSRPLRGTREAAIRSALATHTDMMEARPAP